ncbi:translation initiation factor eIF-3, subunit D [Sistotremastrum niveocremeum HHB9708]|uniref:Eukaryotic translation initiation factor 3 subunit D n=1 Tax=Sistotremastrum niveocremeum HHB9708 TaxID=1314777 RepID=A0A164ZJT3_9AGAM|nr:translation initiation factor eIF-3, subunit D [Sistotremastrum niveocremeum HHB9708]
MSFTLPPLPDAEDTWGPNPSYAKLPIHEVPYAPYSKADKLGRVADWNDLDGNKNANQNQASFAQASSTTQRGGRSGRGRDGQAAFGSGTTNTFAYFHVEDESSFSLVDNKIGGPRRAVGFGGRGRGAPARGGAYAGNTRTSTQRGRGGNLNARGGQMNRGGRRGWKEWDKNAPRRESSVAINPAWKMLEEIEFTRLSKLRLDVDEPETLETYGRLYQYEKSYDRVNTKTERPLQIMDRIRYNTTTSDDPVIQQLASRNVASIYATDSILSVLMCAPRSVYPWDIIIVREGDHLYLDKRDGGPFDTITVNENAAEPPVDPEKDKEKDALNSALSLSLEATYVNQNFSFQVVKEDAPPLDFEKPNPFYGPDEVEPLASCGYRYRLFDLSLNEDEDIKIVVRTEVDAYQPSTGKGDNGLMTIRTLNEFDSRAPGAGGAPDWRSKLDSQRGAVVATEMKNNSCKLAKWAAQSILAGAETMKVGYVSRANPRDNSRHVILSTTTMRPTDFAAQLNVSLSNGWGIVRTVTDMCMKLPDGKYVLIKDPNRPVIRLYAVPMSAFTGEEEIEEEPIPEEEAE